MGTLLKYMNDGGIFMWLIALVSVVAMGITLEKCYYLFYKYRLNSDHFLAYILKLVDSDNFGKAISLCDSKADNPLCRIIKAGLLKANRPDKEIELSLEQASAKVTPNIIRRTAYLSMLSNVSTMLGLLGTIHGLIVDFEAVGQTDAAAKAEMLAKGIAIAMSTTFGGLVVAIPIVIIYGLLQNFQNRYLDDIEHCNIALLNFLSTRNAKLQQKSK